MKTTIFNWIPVTEKMPPNEQDVLITCRRRWIDKQYDNGNVEYKYATFMALAFFEDGTLSEDDSNYTWHDLDNYDNIYNEEKDCYMIPSGWWESIEFGEEFFPVDCEVLAWMPLPKPYDRAEYSPYVKRNINNNQQQTKYRIVHSILQGQSGNEGEEVNESN